jgi:putative transposase
MVSFIDAHRDEYGVEPICSVLPIAPSTYYAHEARRAHPDLQDDDTGRCRDASAGSGRSRLQCEPSQ